MKTVRFASVISRAGKPDHYITWSNPAQDRALRKAVKETRLMTVHQRTRGTKKDFGVVGLELGRDAQYFVFPRSLRSFVGARVVAIDYELAGERLSLTAPTVKPRPKSAPRSRKIVRFPRPAKTAGSPMPAPSVERPVATTKLLPPPPSLSAIEKAVAAALGDLRRQRRALAAKRLTELLKALRR